MISEADGGGVVVDAEPSWNPFPDRSDSSQHTPMLTPCTHRHLAQNKKFPLHCYECPIAPEKIKHYAPPSSWNGTG